MAKLEVTLVADISEIESMIDGIKHLQTYKLSAEDEQILVDRDDVVKIFANHIRANIEPERKKGRWINHVDRGMCECDICGEMIETERAHRAHYCPNCGADMRGGT